LLREDLDPLGWASSCGRGAGSRFLFLLLNFFVWILICSWRGGCCYRRRGSKKKPKQKLTRLGARVPLYRSRTNERHQARKTNTTSTKRYSISQHYLISLSISISCIMAHVHARTRICAKSVISYAYTQWLGLLFLQFLFYLYFVRIDRHMRIHSLLVFFLSCRTQVPLIN